MWERRQFLKAAGVGFLGSLLPRQAAALANTDLIFASACQTPDGNYAAAIVSETGELIRTLALPGRGHDVTQCPVTGRLAIFARRPGNFALIFSPQGEAIASVSTPEDRHFYGHGIFSPDGKLLYATENDFDAARGILGIYDATDGFKRIGEFETGGIGPHDLLFSPDNKLICVANGGIETHPDYGREKLNLATMQPNIVWIDRDNGAIIARHELPQKLHKLSMRHMAPGAGNSVWVGGQFQGAISEEVPLVAYFSPDEDLKFIDLPEPVLGRFSNYVGSVTSAADGQQVVFTSPVGNVAVVLDVPSGDTQILEMANVCGAAWPNTPQPVLSTGDGILSPDRADEFQMAIAFDNHLFSIKRF